MPILGLLKQVFSNKLVTDVRQPLFTFDIPQGEDTITYGFVAPELLFWVELGVVLLVTAICGALTSILIYNYIVRQRGTWNAYLVGYGIIIPICIAFPYVMIPLLEIENKILKFCHISIFPILTMFRCSEAMYGFSPPSVEHSHQTFMLYYANIPHIHFDPKTHVPLKSSWADVKEKLYYFVYELCVVGAVLSFLSPFDYVPWTVEEKGDGVLLLEEVGSLFRWNHILNNLMGAILFERFLNAMLCGLALISTLSGFLPQDTMKSAIFGSTSPSDFWGRKWNLVIHNVLKRGVFKPVRRYYPKHVASAAAFLASGIFHEWILSGIFTSYKGYNLDKCTPKSCHDPIYGNTLAFFLWNGTLIVLEHTCSHLFVFQWAKRTLPIPIISMMVVSCALPVAHWMTYNYIASDFFQNGEFAFPMILRQV